MNAQASKNTWRGKIGRMSQEEFEAFLATDVLCRLGCLDEDGWPYVVPVWFQYRDEGFYIVPRERSAWAGMLKRDPRVFLTIDRTAPQRRVLIKGHAELIEEPNVGGRWVAIAEEMSYRYLGEHGPDYLVPTPPVSTSTIPTRTAPRTSAQSFLNGYENGFLGCNVLV